MKKTILLLFAVLFVLVSAARAGDLADVRNSGVLQFGVAPDRFPFVFYDKNYDLTGIDISLMEEIAERMDLKLDVTEMSSDDLMESLMIGQVDVAGGAFSKTASRQNSIDFTNVYYMADGVFLGRDDLQLKELTEPGSFSGKKIGTLKNSGFEEWLKTELCDKGFILKKDIYTYDKIEDEMRALDKGRIDLAMVDFALFQSRYQNNMDYKKYEYGSARDSYAFGLRKDSDLKAEINRELINMLKDGTAQTIADSFFSDTEPEADPVIRWTDNKPKVTATPLPTSPMVYPVAPTAAPVATSVPVSAPATCNYTMGYVADVTVPDGQPFSAGTPFTKTWRLRNTGNCAWTTAFMFTFVSGSQMGGLNRYLPYTVNPGDTVDISVDLIAPSSPGTYQGYWQIKTPQGVNVGFSVWVTIRVPGAYSYDTPEPEYYYPPTTAPSYSYPTAVPTATPMDFSHTWIESESKWFATMAAGLPTATPTSKWKELPVNSEIQFNPELSKQLATVTAPNILDVISYVDLDEPVVIKQWK